MSPRQPLAGLVRAAMSTLVLVFALVGVGLTAPADSPFSITIEPVFLRLGVDVDVRIGSVHLHASWSALPDGYAVNQSTS